jgi:TatD DNase family protein
MRPALVDFHCHLDLFSDPPSAINEVEAAGIYTLTVTTTPKAWPRNYDMTRITKHVRAGLGLHPQLVDERSAEIKIWEEYLPHTRYIGEVGLDAGPRYFRSLEKQQQIFTHILKKCAEANGKILSVHSVRAAKRVLDLVELHLPRDRGKVVLHWFSGSISEARRALGLGCYFSINTAMTRNERGRKLISALPLDRLLTETDAPFTRCGDRTTTPLDVEATVEELAALRQQEPDSIAATIVSNLRALLNDV